MTRHTCLALSALLILAAPQTATPQASQPCCQADSLATVKPTQPVSSVRGSDKAPITILVFSDFESFPCARSASVIDGLLQQTRDVRVIFKHAPEASNPNAMLAHEAALAAGAQGKFREMHDTLFENQTKLTRADLVGYAKSLGLDLAAFERALDNHTYRPIVERDLAEAAGLGVTTTPTFFVNGRRLVGPQGYASLGAVIESLLAGIPPDKRVQPEIVAAGPAQQIDLARAPTRGPATAPISLVEFSDFECPFSEKPVTGYVFPLSCPSANDSAVCRTPGASAFPRFLGRPIARGSSTRLIFRPSAATNSLDPSGLPVAVWMRIAASSSASSATPNSLRHSSRLMRAVQYCRSSIPVTSNPVRCALALDQAYSPASATMPARTGFLST